MPFATIAPDGSLLDVVEELDDALHVAARAGFENVSFEEQPRQFETGELGASAQAMPEAALRATGLTPITREQVDAMSKQEAHQLFKAFIPKGRFHEGTVMPIAAYDTVSSTIRRLLGQNYKTAKETPEQPSDVQGLSLTPHSILRDYLEGRTSVKTLCLGSSPACRASCLVYSGQNAADPYNLQIKIARTQALVEQPVAFMRLLVESIGLHLRAAPEKPWTRQVDGRTETGRGVHQYFRLNVFQDVPWELLAPWLFSYKLPHRDGVVDFSRASFYDYTKVPGRVTPANYDLTFSYSGSNQAFVEHELKRRRRIAVVFLLPGAYRQRRVAPLPPTYMGFDVVDGDVSDVRPRDPQPGVVGLRWKLPKGTETGRAQASSAFVVPVELIDGQLVATQSARQEPIVDVDVGAARDQEHQRWLQTWAE